MKRNNIFVVRGLLLAFFTIVLLGAACSQVPTSQPTAQPTPTPLGGGSGRISFVPDRDGNWEIYLMNVDGSGQINLTNNPATDGAPASIWSPDGTRLAFVSDRDGNREIYVMNADGSEVTRLTNDPAGDDFPAWSPDGTQIVFHSERDGNAEIYVMKADGSGQTRLTNNPAGDALPSWSPDGTRIAFLSNRDGDTEIYVMDADGSGQVNLTNDPGGDGYAVWSPRGAHIAFVSNRDGNAEIYVMKADGSGQTNLTNNPADDDFPAWSPDGTQIAFASNRDGNLEVYVMDADGSGVTRLTNDPASDGFPAWQPSAAAMSTPAPASMPLSEPTTTPTPLPTSTYTPEPPPTPVVHRYRYEFYSTGMWIPIPQECDAQQDIVQISLSQEPSAYYTDPTYGNKVLYYGSSQGVITGTYELASALPMRYHIEEANIGEYDPSSPLYQLYTRSEIWIEADAPEIIQGAESIVGGETNPFLAARKIYEYVTSHLTGQRVPWTGDPVAYRNEYGALATYRRGYGSCQNQALVFVALCRAAGIPARVVHGINSVSLDENRDLEDWSHAWAEFYLPNYGWIPADPGNVFGKIDNLRIILSFGNNVVIDPPCSFSDWYCDNGTAMFLLYPFGELHFKVTRVE